MTRTFGHTSFITKLFFLFALAVFAAIHARAAGSIRFDGKN
jgi:hypothetical protein